MVQIENGQLKCMVRNVEFMHMRTKGIKRTEDKFYVGEEEISIVEEYKYLGCVVDEQRERRLEQ